MPRGARRLPDECARRLAGADLILHGGDFTGPEVLAGLRRIAPVEAVYGNMDSAELRQTLPQRRVVEVGEARIGMVHIPGPRAGRAERLREWFPDCHAVVYGHTHVPEVAGEDDFLVLNPGSPTERRASPRHTMLMLNVEKSRVAAELVDLS